MDLIQTLSVATIFNDLINANDFLEFSKKFAAEGKRTWTITITRPDNPGTVKKNGMGIESYILIVA